MRTVVKIRWGRNPFTEFETAVDWCEACEWMRRELRLDWRGRLKESLVEGSEFILEHPIATIIAVQGASFFR